MAIRLPASCRSSVPAPGHLRSSMYERFLDEAVRQISTRMRLGLWRAHLSNVIAPRRIVICWWRASAIEGRPSDAGECGEAPGPKSRYQFALMCLIDSTAH